MVINIKKQIKYYWYLICTMNFRDMECFVFEISACALCTYMLLKIFDIDIGNNVVYYDI